MPLSTVFLTGATGLIGSHVLERALAEGLAVRALVRGTPPAFLERPGVTVIRGDLTHHHALVDGLTGATMVVHCAAKVGDWGDASEYVRANVDALRLLTGAAATMQHLKRFVAISSLGVYEPRDHFGTTEAEPACVRGFDPYTRTKAAAETVMQAAILGGLPAVILRPGFVYGPRDRHVLPGLARALRSGQFAFFGSGEQLLDNCSVHNVVDAVFLALRASAAVGETFNITDEPLVSRRAFVGAVARGLGLPPPQRSVPLALARPLAMAFDHGARLMRRPKAPLLSMGRYKFLALHLEYSIEKARRVLGYRPRILFEDGMREAVAWLVAEGGAA